MQTSLVHTFSALGLLVSLRLLICIFQRLRIRKRMPPGPPGLPIIGNIFQLRGPPWIQFMQWKKSYGPIFSLDLAGQPAVVLNDLETITDLIDRRSNIYSGRPRLIMAGEIMTRGLAFPLVTYNNVWRRQRRAAREGFSLRTIASCQYLQDNGSALLALRILDDSHNWMHHIRDSAMFITLGSVYGKRIIDNNAESIRKRMQGIADGIEYACRPGNYLVDLLPWLSHLPSWMAKWKRDGQQWFEGNTAFLNGLVLEVEENMRAGSCDPCFAASLLENDAKSDMSAEEIAWLAGIMFVAGVDTTSSVMSVFVLAMILHPHVMRRAQEEVDAVVGRHRLPCSIDGDQLPYIKAMAMETLRWRPVTPVSLGRSATQDDVYKGYLIPKGTMILSNIWAVNTDERYFPEPDVYRPERYIDETGQINHLLPGAHRQGHLSFGSGRRICVGKDLAMQTLMSMMCTLLWAFDINPAVDDEGKPILPSSVLAGDGVVARPAPFQCSFKPRSSDLRDIIRRYETEE